MLVGDLNFHLNIEDDPNAIRFLDFIDSCGLTKSVVGPTHRKRLYRGGGYSHIWPNVDVRRYWVAFLQEILKHGSLFLQKNP